MQFVEAPYSECVFLPEKSFILDSGFKFQFNVNT